MAPTAVPIHQEDVDHLPLKLGNKQNDKNGTSPDVQDIQMESHEKTQHVLGSFRCLIADLCHQFGCGHPGSAMGMAAIGVALWKYVMKYSPHNPNFLNRDRFVLSNGHACLFQYAFLHLTGYKQMTWEQLLSYHSERYDSITPGHPEIEIDGVEVTTGPLGQGVANAVGLAMATKHLGATYNRPGYDVINNMTWCLMGDACLQEGVGMEAFQLAAHWRLNNLCIIYDRNEITCDGSVDLCSSDDVNAKMTAVGFNVIDIADGNYDVEGIVKALIIARASKDKPTFINVRTTIGVGSKIAGDAKTHGADLGEEDIAHIKTTFGMDPAKVFDVSEQVYDYFREAVPRGQQLETNWNAMMQDYKCDHTELADEFERRIRGEVTASWKELLPEKESLPTSPTPSRRSLGTVLTSLASSIPNFLVGTADLTPSVNLAWPTKTDFQNPDLKPACGQTGDYSGRYIHWGIREHAMAACSNGLAAFNKGTILPVTSTFFMFYMYAAPGLRMGALQGLQSLHIATHDSIGTGEDGPTHQPIALAALWRAMPNFLYIRPCDGEECIGAVTAALDFTQGPSMISVSRQKLPQYHPQHSSRAGVQKGAYLFAEVEGSPGGEADVTLIGCGAEMRFAMAAREALLQEYNIRARVISFPSWTLFERQSRDYKAEVLGKAPRVIIEAYSPHGWERYADAGYSMHSFGQSLTGEAVYARFDFEGGKIALRVKGWLEEVRSEGGIGAMRGEWRDLNCYERDVQFQAYHKHGH